MAHRWNVSHSRDGNALHVYDYDARAVLASGIEATMETICSWSGGRLFGHGLGDWAWRVPVGRPRYDYFDVDDHGEPWLENSLAATLFNAEQALCRWAGKYTEPCKVAEIPLSSEQARVLAPDLLALFDDDDAA